MISADSIRKDAERFGWSASVWLSKQLNGRQPALMARAVVSTTDIAENINARRQFEKSYKQARRCRL
ncbi:MAG: hypothetical protein U0103_30095 [Candidatus Obscuribacterales bacterium]|nr:MAG: hypothetical protein EKK48_23330 [Candidatus Melainabacteria bacterium]